jgi:hypothetical protein
MADQEKKFGDWMRAELCRQKPATKFTLRSASPGTRGSEIESFEIEEALELEEIPVYAGSILQRAQEDADGNGPGVCRYVVHSYRKGDSKPGSRFAFRLRGESDLDLDDESGEEPATIKGLMAQLMRHNEIQSRTMVMAVSTGMASMARRLESADRLNETLVKERTTMFQTIEEAKSDQHTRDMELMLADKSQARKDQAFAKLMGLVPLVINKIAGSKILPDKSDPLMMLLEPLIGSMSQEQFNSIAGTLNPDQQIMFVDLLKTFQERKQLAESNGQTKEN